MVGRARCRSNSSEGFDERHLSVAMRNYLHPAFGASEKNRRFCEIRVPFAGIPCVLQYLCGLRQPCPCCLLREIRPREALRDEIIYRLKDEIASLYSLVPRSKSPVRMKRNP